MITLGHYLVVSGMLFALGLAGVIARRNIIIVYMCLEMMLSAANLALVGFAIIVALFRSKQSVDVESVTKLQG